MKRDRPAVPRELRARRERTGRRVAGSHSISLPLRPFLFLDTLFGRLFRAGRGFEVGSLFRGNFFHVLADGFFIALIGDAVRRTAASTAG